MAISRDLVIKKFMEGKSCSRGNIYTDGETIFSYGSHWPLAIRLKDGSCLFNKDHYGSTTSTHSWDVKYALRDKKIYKASCEDMKDYLSTYPRPGAVVLYRREPLGSVNRIVDDIESLQIKRIGYLQRFPHQKIQNMISDEMLWHQFNGDSHNSVRYYLSKMMAHKFDPMFKIACSQTRKGVREAAEAVVKNLNRSLAKRRHIYSGSRALAKGVKDFRGVIRPHVGAVYVLQGDPIEIIPSVVGYNHPAPTAVLMGKYLNMKDTITTVKEVDAKKMITDAVLENL